MNASGKNPPGYWGIALRFITLLPKFPSRNKSVRSLLMGLLFLLAIPAHAASTVPANGKLWCGTAIPTGLSDCTYSSDTAAGQATVDYLTWYCTVGYLNYCGAPYTYFLKNCDGNGRCGYYTTYGGVVHEMPDFQLRFLTACPANSTPNGTDCTCNTNYVADQAKTSCVSDQLTCPVTALPQPPFLASDACSNSLEQGKGVDVNQACGTLRKPDMVDAEACIAKKIKALSSPPVNYAGPSATIRTEAYQNHLLEIWNKSVQLSTLMTSLSFTPEYLAEMRQACAQRKTEIDVEKQSHGIDSPPSASGNAAPHVEHRAIDVSRDVAKELINQVTIYATKTTLVNGRKIEKRVVVSDVEDYIHSATVNPPACDSNISWGGRFDPIDRVHFQLPK